MKVLRGTLRPVWTGTNKKTQHAKELYPFCGTPTDAGLCKCCRKKQSHVTWIYFFNTQWLETFTVVAGFALILISWPGAILGW